MKKKLLAVFAVMFILMSTGCGADDYLQNDSDEIIIDEATGQRLRKDILCRPDENSDVYEIYKEHENQMDIKLNDLPKCEDFTPASNDANSIWQFLIVKPTAWAIINAGALVGSIGVGVIIVGLLIRILLLPLQIKTSRQTHNMKKAGPEIQKLESKYRNRQDRESQMMKSQEMMMIYKKYKVNPVTGCLVAFIQLPIFFAFLDAIYRTPAIYEETLFGWNLGTTPSVGIQNGDYTYIILVVLIAVSTFFSFRYSMSQTASLNPQAAKTSKMMMNIMTVVIVLSSFSFPAALHFYWIVTYAFIAVQTYLIKIYLGDRKPKKDKDVESKSSKSKIKERLEKKETVKESEVIELDEPKVEKVEENKTKIKSKVGKKNGRNKKRS